MSTGTDFWTPRQFAAATQGRWLAPPVDDAAALSGVSIDTRTLSPGDVFFAIRGEQHDGHDHVAKAIELGAAMVVVERAPGGTDTLGGTDKRSPRSLSVSDRDDAEPLPIPRAGLSVPPDPAAPILLVPDTVIALQQLAAAWRDELRKHHVKVIAVTGSNGKTTTRNLIHAALSSTLRGTQSPKSFNNHLGVPLTLLAAKADDDFVVAEVGTNHPGEIAALAAILRPNVAVITNIGTAHIGMFGGKETIAAEKSSLFKFVQEGGVAVMNGGQGYVDSWKRGVVPPGVRVETFGQGPECDVRTEGAIAADGRGLRFTLDSGVTVQLPLLGLHNVDNTLAAIAVSRALGLGDAAAAKALAGMTGVEMRMQVVRIGGGSMGGTDKPVRGLVSGGESATPDTDKLRPPEGLRLSVPPDASGTSGRGITLINDAYNANPDSMLSALSTLASFADAGGGRQRKVAILGDMLELGDEAPCEHQHIGDMLCVFNQLTPLPPGPAVDPAQRATNRPTKIQLAILIGTHMRRAAEQLARVWPDDCFVYFDKWTDGLPARIAAKIHDDDVVLLKASRGLRLERIVPELQQKFALPAPLPLREGLGEGRVASMK